MIHFARLITFLFHPIVIVTPAVFLIVLATGYSVNEALLWSCIALGFVIFIALYILIGMKIGFFTNFDVSKREQRLYLFPLIILVGITFLFSLIVLNGPSSLFLAIIYFLVSVAVLALVTLKIKASVHVGSITAAIISAIYFFGVNYSVLLILVPIMAWARIKERRHTYKETIVGFVLGLLLALVGVFGVQYFT